MKKDLLDLEIEKQEKIIRKNVILFFTLVTMSIVAFHSFIIFLGVFMAAYPLLVNASEAREKLIILENI